MGTTVDTLSWAVLYLGNNPHIAEELYDEICKTLGKPKGKLSVVKLSNRPQIPLVSATIRETLRVRPSAPLGLPHRTVRDSKLGEFDVKENTTILINVWSLHHDSKYWSAPGVFNPNRFLGESSEGALNEKNNVFVPFGAGIRKCMGFSVALDELFVLLGSIVWNFKIVYPPGVHKFNDEEIDGVTIQPRDLKVKLELR
eukprot:TRINITY_DN884_c0_g1_i1.p1 TRINITY_DN884_c0_g1~~TRINITY_DN884_c0_g1_i1.p1  ORF type:complete len:199 (+),score=26.92 TRINITY_DN884_c0_g1_i1:1072-1668(+)